MKLHTYANRLLAGLLALYAAAGMCRTAAALMEENQRAETLRRSCQSLAAEIAACRVAEAPLPVRAWRQEGMVFPEDTVFFDAGP